MFVNVLSPEFAWLGVVSLRLGLFFFGAVLFFFDGRPSWARGGTFPAPPGQMDLPWSGFSPCFVSQLHFLRAFPALKAVAGLDVMSASRLLEWGPVAGLSDFPLF